MNKALAALSFFTSLPFWRVRNIPPDAYKRVVDLWPLAGWITGGVTACVYYFLSAILPPLASATAALAARLLLTGGLHEDGLADFFDGFGGGTDRNRILAIMKDSHIGSYGVIALIIYFLLATSAISFMPPMIGAIALFTSDAWSKATAAWIINFLPYARTAETAKNKLVYDRMNPVAAIICVIIGAAPIVLLPGITVLAAIAPVIVTTILICYMQHKIGGYTGDCCGATFLLSELVMLIAVSALWLGFNPLPHC